MCGRFVIATSPDGLAVRFLPRVTDSELDAMLASGEIVQVLNNYQVQPTNRVPVITNTDGRRRIEVVRWNLIPSFWKDPDKLPPMNFNARSENLDSGMWRDAFRRSRCLISATGFYEWPVKGPGRPPVFIYREDGSLLAFAGAVDTWMNPRTNELMRSCTIATSKPNSFMSAIHDRMPVVLPDSEAETLWLGPASQLAGVRRLTEPYKWDGMAYHWVRPLRQDANGPELIEPATEQLALA